MPYALDTNDMKFWLAPGYAPQQWLDYAVSTFDQLYDEGGQTPKIMSLGLHLRIIGRPGRIGALAKFMQHVAGRKDVWVTSVWRSTGALLSSTPSLDGPRRGLAYGATFPLA